MQETISPMRLTSPQRQQLGLALLVSLLGHAVLLSLAFSGQGLGRPVLGLPWRDLPVETPNLRVVMVPARGSTAPPATPPTVLAAPTAPGARFARSAPAALPAQASILQPKAGQPSPAASPTAATLVQPVTSTAAFDARPTTVVLPEPTVTPEPRPVTQLTDGVARLSNLRPGTAAMARVDAPEMIAVDRPVQPNGAMSHALPLPLPLTLPPSLAPFFASPPLPTVVAAAAAASGPQRALPAPRAALSEALAHIDPQAREHALDLRTLDASAQESQRQTQRLQAGLADTARLDAEREQAARQFAAREESVRAEAARLEAQLAADRQEAARQHAALAEFARVEAERQATARAATAALEATRAQAAQAAQAAVATQAEADAARREASRRAMGRQLDEEAARRRDAETAAAALPAIAVASAASAAARQPAALPLSWGSARRARLLGRADPNAELVLYAEAWARKIELNLTIEMVRDAARQRHANPLVTVAIRQDGSVESVTFLVSSGVAAIDEAIRRIVQSQAPYPAFPPALARDFDVIEIRRTWAFDMAVRLY